MAAAKGVDPFLLAEKRRDFAVTVEGTPVYVNRHYLADMSAVFDKMFFPETGFDEPIAGLILNDKTLDDFLELLHCVCPTPTIKKIDETNVLLMLSFADEYEIDDLKQRCVDYLLGQLKADFAQCQELKVDIALKASEDYRLAEVRADCVDYLTRRLLEDDIVNGECLIHFMSLAHTYNLEAVKGRCLCVVERHLNSGPVDRNHLINYLCLSIQYSIADLTKRLVPHVAQLDFNQLGVSGRGVTPAAGGSTTAMQGSLGGTTSASLSSSTLPPVITTLPLTSSTSPISTDLSQVSGRGGTSTTGAGGGHAGLVRLHDVDLQNMISHRHPDIRMPQLWHYFHLTRSGPIADFKRQRQVFEPSDMVKWLLSSGNARLFAIYIRLNRIDVFKEQLLNPEVVASARARAEQMFAVDAPPLPPLPPEPKRTTAKRRRRSNDSALMCHQSIAKLARSRATFLKSSEDSWRAAEECSKQLFDQVKSFRSD